MFTACPQSADAARHGRVAVPGAAKLELPAGRVQIHYELDADAIGSRRHPPAGLVVRIVDASGRELPLRLKRTLGVASWRDKSGAGRCYVGRVEIPHAGPHAVSVELPGSTARHGERLCLGR